jgi:gamma-glutamyltranspeptidase
MQSGEPTQGAVSAATPEAADVGLFAGDLNPYFGGVHAVARENGEWRGSADPRRDGAVEHALLRG